MVLPALGNSAGNWWSALRRRRRRTALRHGGYDLTLLVAHTAGSVAVMAVNCTLLPSALPLQAATASGGGPGGGPSGGGLFCADALNVQPASADHSIQCFINFIKTPVAI